MEKRCMPTEHGGELEKVVSHSPELSFAFQDNNPMPTNLDTMPHPSQMQILAATSRKY